MMTLRKNPAATLLLSYIASGSIGLLLMGLGSPLLVVVAVFWIGGAAAALGLSALVTFGSDRFRSTCRDTRAPPELPLEAQLRRWDEDIEADRAQAREALAGPVLRVAAAEANLAAARRRRPEKAR